MLLILRLLACDDIFTTVRMYCSRSRCDLEVACDLMLCIVDQLRLT